VEKLTAEENEARNMSMLAEITLDDKNNKLNDATIELEFFVLISKEDGGRSTQGSRAKRKGSTKWA
jgi:hypothetical protein